MESSGSPVYVLAPGGTRTFPGVVGWTAFGGFDPGKVPWDLGRARIICVGVVDGTTTAAALGVLARGAGLAIEVAVGGAARTRFLEELYRASSPIVHDPLARPAIDRLEPLQRQLLDAVIAGATLTEAADAAQVSRREASRSLAEARTLLGVGSTDEAVSRWAAHRAATGGTG